MKELPNVLEMEKEVLSAMLLEDGKVVPAVAAILKADDFYRTEHKIIYTAILKIYESGRCDFLSLIEELRRTEYLKKIGLQYMHGLLEYAFSTARAERQAEMILEKSKLRQLIRIGENLSEEASKDLKPVDELLSEAEKKIMDVSQNRSRQLIDAKTGLLEAFESALGNKDGSKGLNCGFIDLNKAINGLKKTDLIILAARPSMGKTALALNMAMAASKEAPVIFFSLEMSQQQLFERMLTAGSKVPISKIREGYLNDYDKNAIVQAVELLSERKLFVDDTRAQTLMNIKAQALRVKHECKDLGLIVVDYIQLMQGSKEYRGNRVQEVSEISRGLKVLAGELDVPILALSQLSRAVEMRADKRPQLSDLRESGSIEQDADIVMFLYREDYYDRYTDKHDVAEVNVAKNRNGRTTTASLLFNADIQLFNNFTRKEWN